MNSKLDIRRPNNILQITVGDECKLGSQTRYSVIEPTVMQFRTRNAAADFQGNISNSI